jgi:DNA-directed RNA polymerase subunit RPC12/RpoP
VSRDIRCAACGAPIAIDPEGIALDDPEPLCMTCGRFLEWADEQERGS